MTATVLASGLVARTREIEPPADLTQELEPDGFAWLEDGAGFVTAGTAARVPAARARAALAGIAVDDPIGETGTGVLAVGSLPFDDAVNGELVIPARVTGITPDGRAWRTEIGPAPDSGAPPAPNQWSPSRFAVESRVSRSMWHSQVRALLDAIAAGALAKAVLARDVLVTADAPFDVRTVVERLRRAQGGCFVFAADGLVGATPELLVRRRGATVTSRPMAGTVSRGATGAADDADDAALAASAKDGLEHRLVIDSVVNGLRGCGIEVTTVTDPQVARLATMSHLATTITGHVEGAAPSALELALTLHPTPAVGGAPRDAALTMLRTIETFERGRYAGPVGWVDGRGDGTWGVALRCADLEGSEARLVAGAGIVAGSDPDAEWAETQAKLEPMLQVLVCP